jgi:uncharacterized SAM-binding protein YcdF (DUF218 family)
MNKYFQGEHKRRFNFSVIKNRWVKYFLIGFSPILMLVLYIGLRVAIAVIQTPNPKLLFVLGGGQDREEFIASFSRQHPELDILISSGTDQAEKILEEAGIPKSRIYLDCRATDTVTNFTTVVADLKSRNINHVYLITSEIHMPRSFLIATIVFGSHGIAFTPVTSPTNRKYPEIRGEARTFRDVSRSLIWLTTGRTGESLNGRDNKITCNQPGYKPGMSH